MLSSPLWCSWLGMYCGGNLQPQTKGQRTVLALGSSKGWLLEGLCSLLAQQPGVLPLLSLC